MSKIGQRIKKLRAERNMTQETLAKLLGVGKTTISMYENGNSTPNDDIKIQLSKHFNVSTDYLIGNSDYKNWREEYESKVSESKLEAVMKSTSKYDSGINFINVYGSI
uniref:helix-turn-helix domain-containing protein n=1 Tax=Veillonella caviae TaxID=248316 RepID=UPI0013E08FE9